MLRLVERWDPLVTIDLHVTDGAKFEHDIAIMVEPGKAGDAALQPLGRALRATTSAMPAPMVPPPTTTTFVSAGVNNIESLLRGQDKDYKSSYNAFIIPIKK